MARGRSTRKNAMKQVKKRKKVPNGRTIRRFKVARPGGEVEVRDLRLPRVDYKLKGNKLRKNIIKHIAERSCLKLARDGPLSWDEFGVVVPEGQPAPVVSTHHELSRKARLCLNLPEAVFKKPGNFTKRADALWKKSSKARFSWSVFLTLHSEAFTDVVLKDPSLTRKQVMQQLQKEKKPIWEEIFPNTNAKEHAKNQRRTKIEYVKDINASIQGRSKEQLGRALEQIGDSGPLYVQHALIIMAKGGSCWNLEAMGIKNVQNYCFLGDGALPLLQLLLSESTNFFMTSSLNSDDYSAIALQERDRFHRLAKSMYKAGQIPVIPHCLAKYKNGHYVALPECFGDALCEGHKLLRQLLGRVSLREKESKDWVPM